MFEAGWCTLFEWGVVVARDASKGCFLGLRGRRGRLCCFLGFVSVVARPQLDVMNVIDGVSQQHSLGCARKASCECWL